MSFEELLKKVEEGSATPDEMKELDDKMRMLKMMANILDQPAEQPESIPATAPVLEEADPEMIKKARKKVKARIVLSIVFGSIFAVAAITGAVFWFIFGNAHKSAAANMEYTREECIDMAVARVEEYREEPLKKMTISDVDRHYNMEGGIFNADYVYEVQINSEGTEYEVRVNATNGYVVMTHVSNY